MYTAAGAAARENVLVPDTSIMPAGVPPLDSLRLESELLQQALRIGLGFSESQLSSAIKHFIQVFETVEAAREWIPCDNFSIIVDYILENGDPGHQSLVEMTGKMETCSSSGPRNKSPDRNNNKDSWKMHSAERSAHVTKVSRPNLDLDIGRQDLEKVITQREKNKMSLSNSRFSIHGNDSRHSNGRMEVSEDNSKKISSKVDGDTVQLNSHRQVENSNQPNGSNSKHKLWFSEAISKKVCGLDRNTIHSHFRKKMVPEVSPCFYTTSTSRIPSTLKMEGVSGSKQEHLVTASPSRIGDSIEQLKNDKTILLHSEKNPEASQVDSKETLQSTCISWKIIDLSSRSYVEPDKPPLHVNAVQSVKTENVSSCHPETSELAIIATKDMPTEVASCSNSNSVTTVFNLETCLREGDCEKALNIFMDWKSAGFQVECEESSKNKIRKNDAEPELLPEIPGKKRGFVVSYDISRGLEKLPISCVNEYNTEILPEDFLYITKSVIRQSAHVDTSLSRIGDLHCSCTGDCLRSPEACKCTDSTRGEYAYDETGRLIERLATDYPSGWGTQKGDFITECCSKCCCSINCGNRVVQRGMTKRLQIFMTPNKKGWGIRVLEKIPAHSFVFEYLGEIATNAEQFDRNMDYEKNGVYTYTMDLDADLDMEKKHFGEGLTDSELLVLDATRYGNVSRFLNHRCCDANLFMRPVQIETRDTHYYHAAFFAVRDIEEMEELTWDYGIDFTDKTHQVKAFTCQCKSQFCRDVPKRRKSVKVTSARKK